MNNIKSNIDALTLTTSQATCLRQIEDRLGYPGVVNLFGLHGVGKTFLGWFMEKSGGVAYVVHPSLVEKMIFSENSVVFVDNSEPNRIEFRRLLGILESRNLERIIVVTHDPVDDYVMRIELKLSEEDIRVVLQNLKCLGYLTIDNSWKNLWDGLIRLARD